MRILVTGHIGFTGSYVQACLESTGHEVVGLTADLTDPVAVAEEIAQLVPEAVIHLAGIAFVEHGNTNAFYEVNLIGTLNLLEALAKHAPGIQSILLTSSANVYGTHSEGVLSEDCIPDPCNDYAVSKYAMEKMASLWLERLPIFITRPFNYTGRGQSEDFLIPKIIAHFRRRSEVIELGNLDVSRDFSDVRAVADAYCRLLEVKPVGRVVNVCSGVMHSVRDIIAMLESITGHKIRVDVNPAYMRKNEVKSLCGDPALLRKLIGDWQSVPFEDTLKWMLSDEK